MLKSILIIEKSLLVYAITIEERMLKSAWQVSNPAFSMKF